MGIGRNRQTWIVMLRTSMGCQRWSSFGTYLLMGWPVAVAWPLRGENTSRWRRSPFQVIIRSCKHAVHPLFSLALIPAARISTARITIAFIATALVFAGCGLGQQTGSGATASADPIRITLNLQDPARSTGVLGRGEARTVFPVGYGRHGVTCAGSRFEEGYTPLGRFRVNAIFSADRFVMDPALIARSGKSEAELRNTLFRNMNAIDFDGDGETGEYGIGYVSLAPVGSVNQPFAFNTYNGRFRWYSFAIHGSNNDKRIGQRVTGGCVNVKQPVLKTLLSTVKLGDEVEISATGPCTP